MGPPHPATFFDWVQGPWGGVLRARMQSKGAVLLVSELRKFQLGDNLKNT